MDKGKIVNILRSRIEEKLGRKLVVPSDFNYLILQMQKEIGEVVSLSTLKRIWGYVHSSHKGSNATLSCLARFAGYKDWNSFIVANSEDGEADSTFFIGRQIGADALADGEELEFGWEPNRYCRVVCMGKGLFRVLESLNGKLQCRDTFQASVCSLGLPLYLTNVCRDGKNLQAYIAGKTRGLNLLGRIQKE